MPNFDLTAAQLRGLRRIKIATKTVVVYCEFIYFEIALYMCMTIDYVVFVK